MGDEGLIPHYILFLLMRGRVNSAADSIKLVESYNFLSPFKIC